MASTVSTVSRPSLSLLASEPLRAAGDLIEHLALPAAAAAPSRDGHVVVLFPGLAANGIPLYPLRRHLSRLGYRALDWGRGFNTGPQGGDVDAWLDTLTDEVLASVRRARPRTRCFSLVGWSLGGFYAREIARRVPQPVRRVITIGTPFNDLRGQSNVGWLYRLLNRHVPPVGPRLRARLAVPPPVPTTAIYSRRDGVVPWQSCRHGERRHSEVRDLEVSASHLGMGWNRRVLGLVARELARPARQPAAC
jgi:pimeloyl-ACP methyl ester carboxylesterase